MKLPREFPQLGKLLEQMEAELPPFPPPPVFPPPRAEIDDALIGSVPVRREDFSADGEIFILQNRKVLLYLQDAGTYYARWQSYPKYHVVHCLTLQGMQANNQYHRYSATRRSDGKFLVYPHYSNELTPVELVVCKNCLTKLVRQYGTGVFPPEPEEFPLADWFETFDGHHRSTPAGSSHATFDYSSDAWRERSRSCRERAEWQCEQCGIDLESAPHLLHAHHKWGTEYNKPEDLKALCIGCHAEQPGSEHQTLKSYPDYLQFMERFGEEWQSRSKSNSRIQRPPRIHGQYATQHGRYHVSSEDDIPF